MCYRGIKRGSLWYETAPLSQNYSLDVQRHRFSLPKSVNITQMNVVDMWI